MFRKLLNETQNVLEAITGEQLHKWYLEATKKLNPGNYNKNAQKEYDELNKEQQYIDKYIANKINQANKKDLEDIIKIQKNEPTVKGAKVEQDEYMVGLTNGLEVAKATVTGEDPNLVSLEEEFRFRKRRITLDRLKNFQDKIDKYIGKKIDKISKRPGSKKPGEDLYCKTTWELKPNGVLEYVKEIENLILFKDLYKHKDNSLFCQGHPTIEKIAQNDAWHLFY